MALSRIPVDGIFDTVTGLMVALVPAGSVGLAPVPVVRSVTEQRDIGTANFTVGAGVTDVTLAGSGTVQVTTPATPYDGQLLNITLEAAYTAVTVAANTASVAQTIVAGVALTVTAGSFARFRYRAATLKWLRIG